MAKIAMTMICLTTGVAGQEKKPLAPSWGDTFQKSPGWDIKEGKLTFDREQKNLCKSHLQLQDGQLTGRTYLTGRSYDNYASEAREFCGWVGHEQRPTFEASKGHTQESFDFIYRKLDKREGEGYETHVESCMAGYLEATCETGTKAESIKAVVAVAAENCPTCRYAPGWEKRDEWFNTRMEMLANGTLTSPCVEEVIGSSDTSCETCPYFYFDGESSEIGYLAVFCSNCDQSGDLLSTPDNPFAEMRTDNVHKLRHQPTCYAGKPFESSSAMVPYVFSLLAAVAYFVV